MSFEQPCLSRAISLPLPGSWRSRWCFLPRIVPIRSDLSDLTGISPVILLIMKHRIAGLVSFPRGLPCSYTLYTARLPGLIRHSAAQPLQLRSFAITCCLRREAPKPNSYDNSNARPAADLNNDITQEEKDHFAKKLAEDKGRQIRTPWHREGSDVPPVARERSAGAMTKGITLQPQSLGHD